MEQKYITNKSTGKNLAYDIMNRLRDRISVRDYVVATVSISALAYWYKASGTHGGVLEKINDCLRDEITKKTLCDFAQRYWSEVEWVSTLAEAEDFKEMVLGLDFSDMNAREMGGYNTPNGIAKLVIELLDIKSDDIVLNLCSGYADFLTEIAKKTSPKQSLIGVELNTSAIQVANIRIGLMDRSIEIIQGNMLSQDFSKLKANKVFSDFPFMVRGWNDLIKSNKKLYPYFENAKKTLTPDWVYATATMLNQEKSGRTVVRMANAGLWNEVDQDIRKMFIMSGLVEAVISMPEKLLDDTMIPFTLLVLSQNNKSIKMVDATDFYTAGRRQNTIEDNDIQNILEAYRTNSDKSKEVTIEELEKQEYILNPLRYISIPNFIGKMTEAVSLGDIVCVPISRGAVVRSSELDELISIQPTNFQYLMLKDISNGRLSDELPYLVGLEEKYAKFCIKNGDLIISKISPFKVAMAEIDESKNVLANGNLYFLEIDETKANPIYVMLYLQSETGMMQLNSWAKGAVMKSISIKDLQKILIPVIPLEQQNKIADEYRELNSELLVVSRQATLIRDKIEHLVEEVL